jgi:hypothetical protein
MDSDVRLAPDASDNDVADSFQDVGVHQLSRMVLQSLHFSAVSPLSPNVKDASPSSTLSSCATGSDPSAQAPQQTGPS